MLKYALLCEHSARAYRSKMVIKGKFWLRQQKHNKRQQKHNQKLKLPFVRIVKKTDTKILRNYLLLKTYDKCYAMVGICAYNLFIFVSSKKKTPKADVQSKTFGVYKINYMTNVGSKFIGADTKQKYLSNKPTHSYLDTSAQLSTDTPKYLKDNYLQGLKYSKESLQKRARAKAFTYSYLFDLIDLKSGLAKGYWQTYHCSSVILQDGNKINSRFCNQRWCLICNRIRTAKVINGYKESIEKFSDAHFLTLTIPNVKGSELVTAINSMNKAIRDITKNAKKTYKLQIKALKKYECTHNKRTDEYHPHFHFIVNDKKTGELMLKLWLDKFPKADIKGQDLSQANETSLVELCKYFTKIISKDNDYNPKALDTMFRAARNKRTFQAIGMKKQVSEEVEEIQEQEIDFKEEANEIFIYDKSFYDWVSAGGECLSEYVPTKQDFKVIRKDYAKTD